jgi:hypothetical protein
MMEVSSIIVGPVPERPWQMSAVYVNDYILAAVESPDGTTLQRTGRAARWACSKELLGFGFDGQLHIVHLTQRKALGITEATTQLLGVLRKNRATVQKFQSVVGKLRHVATILPSARSLFTPVNKALRGSPHSISL